MSEWDIFKAALANSAWRKKMENALVCDRCRAASVTCVPSRTGLRWVVCAQGPLKPSSTSQGVQWELEKKDGCQVEGLRAFSHFQKNKKENEMKRSECETVEWSDRQNAVHPFRSCC